MFGTPPPRCHHLGSLILGRRFPYLFLISEATRQFLRNSYSGGSLRVLHSIPREPLCTPRRLLCHLAPLHPNISILNSTDEHVVRSLLPSHRVPVFQMRGCLVEWLAVWNLSRPVWSSSQHPVRRSSLSVLYRLHVPLCPLAACGNQWMGLPPIVLTSFLTRLLS